MKVSIWTNSPSRLLRALPRLSAPALRRAARRVLAFVCARLSAVPASASQADDYRNAVHRALTLVQFAERGDAPSVGQALQALDSAPGPGQPEILKDLRAEPPNLTDADQRLQALFTALQASVDTPDPERAREQLTTILSMPRYVGLPTGPPLWVRIVQAVGDALARFLNWLGGGHLTVQAWRW